MNRDFDIDQLVSYLTGNSSKKEQLLVEQWIALSEENMLLFDEFKKVWDSSSIKTEGKVIDVDKAWAEFKIRTNFVETSPIVAAEIKPTNTIKKILFYSYRVAALAVVLFGLYFLLPNDSTVEIHNYTASSVQVESPLILSDGSSVIMNKGARINYPNDFGSVSRNVNFKGEAFFDIAHNPDKPMIIGTGDVRVKVLGTSFDLCNFADSDEITVYLETGKILFYSVDEVDGSILEQIILYPGQKGVYNKNTGLITKYQTADNNHVAWKTGVLEFTNAPLTDVIKVLERTYQVNIKPEINIDDYHLTARFNNESLTSIFESLEIIYNFKCEINNGSVVIY